VFSFKPSVLTLAFCAPSQPSTNAAFLPQPPWRPFTSHGLAGCIDHRVKGRFARAIAYLKKQNASRPGKTAEIRIFEQVRDQDASIRLDAARRQVFLSGNVVLQAFFG